MMVWTTRPPSRRAPRRSTPPLPAALAAMLLLGISANAAPAQSETVFRVLTVPSGAALRCHVAASTAISREPADVSFRFELGGVPPAASRTIDAVYDSAGDPRVLVDAVVNPNAGATTLDAITARFGPNGSVGGFHPRRVSDDSAARSRGPATADTARVARRSKFVSLSTVEKERALTLAHWLWAHRC